MRKASVRNWRREAKDRDGWGKYTRRAQNPFRDLVLMMKMTTGIMMCKTFYFANLLTFFISSGPL